MFRTWDDTIEVNIERKRFFIILGAAALTLLLVLFAIISVFNRANENDSLFVTEVTLCDQDDSGLCIVSFGANNLDRMVINFLLPDAEYPLFYVKASNRGMVNVYSCEVVEAVSTSAYCTGVRTPLGESIDITVYTTDGDVLIAHGTFIVSAILISTSDHFVRTPEISTETPTPTVVATRTTTPTVVKTRTITPTGTVSTLTSTLETAYPNPSTETAYPNP